jgi:hypothetical protein
MKIVGCSLGDLAGLFKNYRRCGILPHSREERQDAAPTQKNNPHSFRAGVVQFNSSLSLREEIVVFTLKGPHPLPLSQRERGEMEG